MAKQNSYQVIDTHVVVPGTTTRVRLPLSGYTTHMMCHLKLTVTTDAAFECREDPFANFIKGVRIRASGAKTYFDVSDGRQWKYVNYFQYKGRLELDAIPDGVNAAVDFYAAFPIHLGLVPGDFFDISGVIPNVELTDLIMEVTWGALTDLEKVANCTAITGEMKITNYEIALDYPAEKAEIWKGGLPHPRFEPRILPITAIYSNLGLEQNIPVGDTIIRSTYMVLATTGLRSESNVSEIGIKLPQRREEPWRRDWRAFQASSQAKHEFDTQVVGVGQIDWSDVSGRKAGYDLSQKAIGTVVGGFSASPGSGNIHMLHYLMS